MQEAAKRLVDEYQTNILLKGGHLEGDKCATSCIRPNLSTIYMRRKK